MFDCPRSRVAALGSWSRLRSRSGDGPHSRCRTGGDWRRRLFRACRSTGTAFSRCLNHHDGAASEMAQVARHGISLRAQRVEGGSGQCAGSGLAAAGGAAADTVVQSGRLWRTGAVRGGSEHVAGAGHRTLRVVGAQRALCASGGGADRAWRAGACGLYGATQSLPRVGHLARLHRVARRAWVCGRRNAGLAGAGLGRGAAATGLAGQRRAAAACRLACAGCRVVGGGPGQGHAECRQRAAFAGRSALAGGWPGRLGPTGRRAGWGLGRAGHVVARCGRAARRTGFVDLAAIGRRGPSLSGRGDLVDARLAAQCRVFRRRAAASGAPLQSCRGRLLRADAACGAGPGVAGRRGGQPELLGRGGAAGARRPAGARAALPPQHAAPGLAGAAAGRAGRRGAAVCRANLRHGAMGRGRLGAGGLHADAIGAAGGLATVAPGGARPPALASRLGRRAHRGACVDHRGGGPRRATLAAGGAGALAGHGADVRAVGRAEPARAEPARLPVRTGR